MYSIFFFSTDFNLPNFHCGWLFRDFQRFYVKKIIKISKQGEWDSQKAEYLIDKLNGRYHLQTKLV